jgi:hypothetical protein
MSVLFHIKKQIRKIRERFPFLKKYPFLFWLLLPVLFFSLKAIIAVLFGSLLVEILNIAVPDWIVVMILAILLYLFMFIIYRLLRSKNE